MGHGEEERKERVERGRLKEETEQFLAYSVLTTAKLKSYVLTHFEGFDCSFCRMISSNLFCNSSEIMHMHT